MVHRNKLKSFCKWSSLRGTHLNICAILSKLEKHDKAGGWKWPFSNSFGMSKRTENPRGELTTNLQPVVWYNMAKGC